jgi:hypothetical protein
MNISTNGKCVEQGAWSGQGMNSIGRAGRVQRLGVCLVSTLTLLALQIVCLAQTYDLGDRVRVTTSPYINVRNAAAGALIGTQATGALGTLVSGPASAALPGDAVRVWYQVNWDSGIDGWCATSGFEKVTPPTTTYAITPNLATVNENAGSLTFTITRSGGLPAETLYASTTQTEGSSNVSDYSGIDSQAVSFTSGQTTRTVTVTILDDTTTENNETFGFIVQRLGTEPASTYLAKSTFTISDNDPLGTTYAITPNLATVNENAGSLTFTITRSGGLPAETVYASTTQTEGSSNVGDYGGIDSQAVSFTSGQTTRTVTVTILDDTTAENNETFGFIVQRLGTEPASTHLAKSTFIITDNDLDGGAGDYPGAIWDPAHPFNYTPNSRAASDIRWVVVHTTEDAPGSDCSTSRNWFRISNNTSSTSDRHQGTSAHYVICRDGTVYQMVRDRDIAHHAGNWDYNERSIGIEHERHDTSNSTEAQFRASAALVKWLATQYNIQLLFPGVPDVIAPENPANGTGIIGHRQVPDPDNPSLPGGAGHRTDPVSWDWAQYQALYNSVAFTVATSVSPPGSGTASGGGVVNAGQSVTVVASANPGYAFINWTENGSEVSPLASFTFTASGNRNLVANFQSAGPCPLLKPSIGVAIITHGYQIYPYLPVWPALMVTEIQTRLGVNSAVFTLKIVRDGLSAKLAANQSLDISPYGSAIIVVDWSEVASEGIFNVPTAVIGDLISDFLQNNQTLLQVPLHLIGHSRGGSVNSRVAWRLAGCGIVVDQVTMLDPHPSSILVNDFEVQNWSNILFADNYYRTDGYPPLGISVAGSFQQVLNGIVSGAGDGAAHEQVHSYYHGTIPMNSVAGTTVDGVTIQGAWYDDSLSPLRLARDLTGFALSKGGPYGLALRPREGIHEDIFGTGTRTRLTPSASVSAWPNVSLEDLFISNNPGYTFRVGDVVHFDYYYQDADSLLNVTFSKDTDTNPFNDSADSCHATIAGSFTKQPNTSLIGYGTFDWAATATDVGQFYIKAKVTDGTHTRYDYLTQPITVNAAATSPDLTVTSVVSASSSATAGSSVNVSYTLKNIGNAASGTFSVCVSLGTSVSGTQIRLADYAVTSLSENQQRAESRTVTIPEGVTPGSYWVTVYADGSAPGVVIEAREDNNIGTSEPNQISISAPSYAVVTAASPPTGGTTSGGNQYPRGANITVQASPASGYHFVNWTENGHEVSMSATYPFVADANRSLVANFAQDGVSYTIAARALPSNGGAVDGTGTFAGGTTRTVTAAPNDGFVFVNWTEGGQEVSTLPGYIFTLNADRDLVANFTPTPLTYAVHLRASPSEGGTVGGDGTFAADSFRTVTATPTSGFAFVDWTEGGMQVSTSAVYGFPLSANRDLVANFTPIPVKYSVRVSALPNEGGMVTGEGSFAAGSSVTTTAVPNAGYRFVNWTEAGAEVCTSASYEFVLKGDRNLLANFISASSAHLTGVRIEDDAFRFVLNGPAGGSYMIQVSSNLLDWSTLSTNTIPAGGSIAITDVNNPSQTCRFYQAREISTGSVTSPPVYTWVRTAGGIGEDLANGVAIGANGRCYVTGTIQGTATFGSTTVTSFGYADMFLAAYSAAGELLWVTNAGGGSFEGAADSGNGVAVDASANIYVTGCFRNTGSFGSIDVSAGRNGGVFLAKYDSLGRALWVRQAGGGLAAWGTACAVDAAGDVYLTGAYYGGAPFWDGYSLSSAGEYDVFLAKVSADGDIRWLKNLGGPSYHDFSGGIAVEGGNCFISGCLGNVPFVASYDSQGNQRWLRQPSGSGSGWVVPAAGDGAGGVYFAGEITGSATFGGINVSSAGEADALLGHLDASGDPLWVKTFGGSKGDGFRSAKRDGEGNLVVNGYFQGSANISGTNLVGQGSSDSITAKFTPDGALIWAVGSGGGGDDMGKGVAVDLDGSVVVVGSFSSTALFGSESFVSAGATDGFISRLSSEKTASVNLLTNGSFELPAVSETSFLEVVPGSTELTGWSVGGGGGPITLGKSSLAAEGQQDLTFNSGNRRAGTWIAQSIQTVIGQHYDLSFCVGRVGGGGGSVSMRASAISESGEALAQISATPSGSGYGAAEHLAFTAASSSTTIEFLDVSVATEAVDLQLDNVVVQSLGP